MGADMTNSTYQRFNIFTSLEKDFDEQLFILLFHKNRFASWVICAIYTFAVLAAHRWMKNRPPLQFGALVLPIWNALFAICNLLIFMKVASTRFNVLWNYGIAHYYCHFYSHVGQVAFWNCIFFLSKFVWLIDIMFLILRKKTLTPFRFFHHISALVYYWYMITERQGLSSLNFLNTMTTSIFYGVPLLTSLIPSATRTASLFMIGISLFEVGYKFFCV